MNAVARDETTALLRDLGLAVCATCGRARMADPATADALYAVANESPGILDYVCGCSDR